MCDKKATYVCPCGRGPASDSCLCGELEIERYRRRASGPLLDRIDLFVRVERISLEDIDAGGEREDSGSVRDRIVAARERQSRRWSEAGLPVRTNARLPARELPGCIGARRGVLAEVRRAAERLGLSARAWHRLLRVARTCADLDASDGVEREHLHRALRFRAPRRPTLGVAASGGDD